MKLSQFLTAFTFLVFAASLVISPTANSQDLVNTISDITDPSLVNGLESLIPTVISTIFNIFGESNDNLSTVIPNVLTGLNITSIDPEKLLEAAQGGLLTGSIGGLSSDDPSLAFVATIVNETFKVMGVSVSTIISNLPEIISTLVTIFGLTAPDLISLILGIASGNPISIVMIIKVTTDVIQSLSIGVPQAISIIQQIIQNLNTA